MAYEDFEHKRAAILSTGVEEFIGDNNEGPVHTLIAYRVGVNDLTLKHLRNIVDSPGDRILPNPE